ncbi:MAG: sulfatase/phosphatase domain-containing protein [Bacteroidota bacterium]
MNFLMKMIIRWPKKISPGKVSQRLVANYDILPTFIDITGYKGTVNTDGLSFYQDLIGKGAALEHEYVVFSSFLGPALITKDGWKLRSYLTKDVFELYYLPDDYREEHDLSKQNYEKLKELKIKLLEACDGDYNNGLYTHQKNQIDVE